MNVSGTGRATAFEVLRRFMQIKKFAIKCR